MWKLIGIVILWVYYTIPVGLSFSRQCLLLFFKFYNYFLWLRITDEGTIPELRIWSILLIKSYLKWCIHLSRSLFFIFQLLDECHCWWTNESPRANVARFFVELRLRLIRNFLRASKFSVLKLIEIVILWVYYTIPVGLSFIRHFYWYDFSSVTTTFFDEGSLTKVQYSEIRIWSILLIKSDFKWCIYLSRSLYVEFFSL